MKSLRSDDKDTCAADSLPFLVAGGRVCGTEHRRTGRGCQDAFAWQRVDGCLLATVADGCGSGRYSEVGAILGVRLWTAALADLMRESGTLFAAGDVDAPQLVRALRADIWPQARARVAERLSGLARGMGGSVADNVRSHLLFTLVGALVTPAHTVVYSLGDGVYGINGGLVEIGPFPENRPPYLSYDVVEERPVWPVVVNACWASDAVQSVILATDGLAPLLAEPTLVQEFARPRYVRNRDAVRRRLSVLNRERRTIFWDERRVLKESGRFADDVALIILQKRVHEPEAGRP